MGGGETSCCAVGLGLLKLGGALSKGSESGSPCNKDSIVFGSRLGLPIYGSPQLGL